jgi:hypothetical protein
MKRSAKPLFPQMNLPLGNVSATNNLDDQNQALLVALTELLVGAAEEESEQPRNGGEDESEANA